MFLGKRIFEENFDKCKIILFYLIRKVFGVSFKLHSNVEKSKCPLTNFSFFYQELLTGWIKYFLYPISVKNYFSIKIYLSFYGLKNMSKLLENVFMLKNFFNKQAKFVENLFKHSGNIKPWVEIKKFLFIRIKKKSN